MLDPKHLYFLPLGGSDEIGMNLNLYYTGGKWLMVDCGISFARDTLPGADVIMPDPGFIEAFKDDLLGIVLTHAHEDHLGAVPYLWDRFGCDIYASSFTAAVLRAKLDGRDMPIHEFSVPGSLSLGPFDLEMIQMTHSIPEPTAIAITTDHGTVLHTGDWKHDPNPLVGKDLDETRLKEIGQQGVLAMVCDSTNVFVSSHTGSEADVRDCMHDLFADFDGHRIVVGCFASNIARIETVARAAQSVGRKVVLLGWSLGRMVDAAQHAGYLLDIPDFVGIEEARDIAADKLVYLCTGSQGEPRAALARIAGGTHPDLKLSSGDIVFFSSREIPGNEQSIARIQNQLVRNGVEVVSASEIDPLHVSGHPSRVELKALYEWVKPNIAIPVHGEARHLHAHSDLATELGIKHSIVPHNGALIRLSGKPKLETTVAHGTLVSIERHLVSIDDPAFSQRRKLSYAGQVSVSLCIDKGQRTGEVKVTTHGIPDQVLEKIDIAKTLCDILDNMPKSLRKKTDDLAEQLRIALRRAICLTGYPKAVVTVHILETDR